ncbi:hypothetical protein COT68_02945 [bacterium (Candidatus Torokbacteria) CG09_land_8_20_14_0_10_42_11]|nr:MAG: hypothetical protein COT68_02945 [bacterium (Candidatus Torokbacteria) CG09_land_8_20_14_0_10_42_11]
MIPYFFFDHLKVGPLTFYPWGFMVGLGFLASFLFTLRQWKRAKMDPDKLINLSLWIIFGGLAGSRLLFVLENFKLFFGDFWPIFYFWQGGMSFYGGLIGGIAAFFFYSRKRLNFLRALDLLVFSLPLGFAIGRLGCFLVNDHLGAPTRLPWAIRYPDGALRHPVALYLILLELLLFFFLIIIKNKVKTPGLFSAFYLLLEGCGRFVLDFTRSRETNLPFADEHYFGFTLAQFISVLLVAISLCFIFKIKKTGPARILR